MPPTSLSDDQALTLGASKQQAVCAPPSRQHKAVVRLQPPAERPYYIIETSEHAAYNCILALHCMQLTKMEHLMCAALMTPPAAPAVKHDGSDGPRLS